MSETYRTFMFVSENITEIIKLLNLRICYVNQRISRKLIETVKMLSRFQRRMTVQIINEGKNKTFQNLIRVLVSFLDTILNSETTTIQLLYNERKK